MGKKKKKKGHLLGLCRLSSFFRTSNFPMNSHSLSEREDAAFTALTGSRGVGSARVFSFFPRSPPLERATRSPGRTNKRNARVKKGKHPARKVKAFAKKKRKCARRVRSRAIRLFDFATRALPPVAIVGKPGVEIGPAIESKRSSLDPPRSRRSGRLSRVTTAHHFLSAGGRAARVEELKLKTPRDELPVRRESDKILRLEFQSIRFLWPRFNSTRSKGDQ